MSLKNSIRFTIVEWLARPYKPEQTSEQQINNLVDKMLQIITEKCVDANEPEDYETICAYCSRPAHTKYG